MKNTHFLLLLLTSATIGLGIHYLEYRAKFPRPTKCFSKGISCFKNYKDGLEAAKIENKPVLLFFSGLACVNCSKFVEKLYEHPTILKQIQKEFVLIVLDVDDRTLLPLKDQFTHINHQGKEKEIKRIGDKWSYFATECHACCSQPKFFLLNSKEEFLVMQSLGYESNLSKFETFLADGLRN